MVILAAGQPPAVYLDAPLSSTLPSCRLPLSVQHLLLSRFHFHDFNPFVQKPAERCCPLATTPPPSPTERWSLICFSDYRFDHLLSWDASMEAGDGDDCVGVYHTRVQQKWGVFRIFVPSLRTCWGTWI